MGLARSFLNFLDLRFDLRFEFYCCGFGLRFDFFFFNFFDSFCGKIWVLLLWLCLGLGMGKIGADLRLERDISEEWPEKGRGTREKRKV